MVKISVVVPVFNNEKNLPHCLDTIINQTLTDLEILCINDGSTDNSANILNQYSKKDSRIKIINQEHKGLGVSLNIGLDSSKGKYIFVMDANECIEANALDELYGICEENKLDFAGNFFDVDYYILNNILDSNNHIEFKLKNDFYKLYLKINEYSDSCGLIEENDFQKIIKNIRFSDDLTNTKHVLSFFIKTYKQMYALVINTRFEKIVLDYLIEWCNLLISSDLLLSDRFDLFRFSKPLFDMCDVDEIQCSSDVKEIITLIHENNYEQASIFSNKLSGGDIFNNNSPDGGFKDKDIFILFENLEVSMQGLLKADFNQANLFFNAGYPVTLLNIDTIKDVSAIMDGHYKLDQLNEKIKVLNLYEYYSDKNTVDSDNKKYPLPEIIDDSVKKLENSDNSVTLQYYDENRLIKEELYISGYLASKKIFNNEVLEYEYYYTCDGFNYVYRDHINNDFILFDRFCENYMNFNDDLEFQDYFVTEMCVNASQKPYLINNSSSSRPSIKNIHSDIAYKIGVVHVNSYHHPYCYGSSKWYLSTLEDYENEDVVVVLTDTAKEDFKKEFGADNCIVIPNIIEEEDIERSNVDYEKDENVISIYARIANTKNISDLIRAFEKVVEVHDDAILKIFGEPRNPSDFKEKDYLIKLVEELNLSSSVKFMGQTDNVFEEMGKSIATVLCSHIEGLPMVILESMVNSTPVVSYDTFYGPRDVIDNGKTGFVVEKDNIEQLSDAIIEVLDNPERSKEMGKLARQQVVENYSEKIVLKKWESLFEELYLNDSDV